MFVYQTNKNSIIKDMISRRLYIFQTNQQRCQIENAFFLYCVCRKLASRCVNESGMLNECLRRHERILLRYCETESCEWRRRYFGALRRHELRSIEWRNSTSFSTPPYFSYTVLTFFKDKVLRESEHHRKVSSHRTNWMNPRNNRPNRCTR